MIRRTGLTMDWLGLHWGSKWFTAIISLLWRHFELFFGILLNYSKCDEKKTWTFGSCATVYDREKQYEEKNPTRKTPDDAETEIPKKEIDNMESRCLSEYSNMHSPRGPLIMNCYGFLHRSRQGWPPFNHPSALV